MKLLLDTDIGSDIDDAVCLAYLLARKDCDLLGITTVSGEPESRAMMASAQCRAAGRAVPIFPGAADPLIVAPRQPKAPQAEMLARWPHDTQFARGEAVGFLRDAIRDNPGEVTLFAIGPLTNIALLLKTDPEIPSLLKEFVIMGGDFRTPPPANWKGGFWEWNMYCDPHAAAIVFSSDCPVRAVGIEVTTQVWMDAPDVRARFARHALLAPVSDFAEVWFRDAHGRIIFHDPLAAVTLFDDQICTFERGVSSIELAEDVNHARTYWRPDPNGRHQAATTVNAARFFDSYFAAFGDV
jgi:purine nucleosidase